MNLILSPSSLSGKIQAIPSKSYAHRIAICNFLAGKQPSAKCGQFSSNDIFVTENCLRALNAGEKVLDCGESGSTLRFLMPLCAVLGGDYTFICHGKLIDRPNDELFLAMQKHGVSAVKTDKIFLSGKLNSGEYFLRGDISSQYISGLLMALPFSQKNTSLIVREPKSIPYMFITLEVLKKFGIKVGNDMLGGRDFIESGGDWSLCTEIVFKVKGGQKYKAADIDLEGDWSAAANFLVAGAVFGKLGIRGLDTTSLQADLSIMDILMDAGASLSQLDGDKGDITVQRAPLKAFAVDASNCPDLFPIISVLAAFCQGTSRMAGVGRLANKESDRAKAIVDMLTQMGVKACIEGDELVVEGHSLAQRLMNMAAAGAASASGSVSGPGLLKGGDYTSHHDHRMVMALKVASLGADSPIVIDDQDCVGKSFPQFLEMFDAVVRN